MVRKKNPGSKRKQLKELDDLLKDKRNHKYLLEQIKDSKIPFYEKLPKDSQFYRHYMNCMQTTKLGEAANDQVKLDQQIMHDVNDEIRLGMSPPKKSKQQLIYDPIKTPSKSPTKKW